MVTKALLMFAAIGIALLVADRLYRINTFMRNEGFQNKMAMMQRCGVDMADCSEELKCMNGFCLSTDIFTPPNNQLPVYP
jgi:hypothetical protein